MKIKIGDELFLSTGGPHPESVILKCVPHIKDRTNADRIRAMSDEELAKFMRKPFCDKRTDEECKISYCGVCDQCILDWLRQPAEEAAR